MLRRRVVRLVVAGLVLGAVGLSTPVVWSQGFGGGVGGSGSFTSSGSGSFTSGGSSGIVSTPLRRGLDPISPRKDPLETTGERLRKLVCSMGPCFVALESPDAEVPEQIAVKRDECGNISRIENRTAEEVMLDNGLALGPHAVVEVSDTGKVITGYVTQDGTRYEPHSIENLTEHEVKVEGATEPVMLGPKAKLRTEDGRRFTLLRGYMIAGGRKSVAGQPAGPADQATLTRRYLTLPQQLDALLSHRHARGEVSQAQARLKTAGFNPGPIDGLLGPRTLAALRQYQATRTLPVTGVLDEATQKALGLQAEQVETVSLPSARTDRPPHETGAFVQQGRNAAGETGSRSTACASPSSVPPSVRTEVTPWPYTPRLSAFPELHRGLRLPETPVRAPAQKAPERVQTVVNSGGFGRVVVDRGEEPEGD